MLQREVELRTCPATLEKMERVEAGGGDWVMVAEQVQRQVLQEFATRHKFGLHDLRLAALRHPEICFWVKYNRACRGNLRVGDVGPNVNLLRALDGQPTKLFLEGCEQGDRTIVVAGSLS